MSGCTGEVGGCTGEVGSCTGDHSRVGSCRQVERLKVDGVGHLLRVRLTLL